MAADAFVRDGYWNLIIWVPNSPAMQVAFRVESRSYFINTYPGCSSQLTLEVSQKQANIDRVRSRAAAQHKQVHAGAFARCRVGKATPGDMEHVLNLGVETGVIPFNQAAVQRWCDANLGVDCTGFVYAYFADRGVLGMANITNYGCHAFLRDARQRNRNPFVWSSSDVQPDDILLWMNDHGTETKRPGHIAVVYGFTGTGVSIAQSPGSSDGHGHSGPQLTEIQWPSQRITKDGGECLNYGSGIVCVRCPYQSAGYGGPVAYA